MNYEKYLIKRGKEDLLSSLRALDKDLLNEKFKEFGVKNIYELKDYILYDFEFCLNESKDDDFTKMYFERLMYYENSEMKAFYMQDLDSLLVFVYKNGDYYSYYIPTEIKQIINKLLDSISTAAKFNLEHAENTPINKDLKEILETLKVSDLKNIGDLLYVNKLSNKPKKELVKIVYNSLINKDKLTDLIERFIDKEFNLLKDLIENKGTIQDNNISVEAYHFLEVSGLVFTFRRENKFYISMTNDVYDVVKNIDFMKMQKIVDENTKMYNLVRSMIELYGVVSDSYLNYYYSLYYGNGDELEVSTCALSSCDRVDNIDTIFREHNTYFVNKILKKWNLKKILDDVISRQEKIRRKKFKLEELLKYSNYDYYEETEAKTEFKKYLKKMHIPFDAIEVIIKKISDMYRLGNTYINDSIEILKEYGVEITEQNFQEILSFLMEIYNNSRIWVNNGWTPIEMKNEYNKVIE